VVDCVGIVRFSVLSTLNIAFQVSEGRSFDSLAEAVLNDQRLAMRFSLFENICLPSYASQTDQNFRLLIVAPRLMPDRWMARLEALKEKFKFLSTTYESETDFTMRSVSPLIFDELISGSQIFSTFRTDDDDGVHCDFVKRLRQYHTCNLINHGVSFCKGYFMDFEAGADKIGLKKTVVPNIAVGLGFISSQTEKRTIFDVSDHHHRMHQWAPVITDARRPNFLVSNHTHNDTGVERKSYVLEHNGAEVQRILTKKGFTVYPSAITDALKSLPQQGK